MSRYLYIYLTELHTDSESKAESNAIQCRIDYSKGRGAMLFLTGVNHDKDEPPTDFRYMPIGSPKEHIVIDDTMKRNSEKKIDGLRVYLEESVSEKAGLWKHITAFAEKHKMKI